MKKNHIKRERRAIRKIFEKKTKKKHEKVRKKDRWVRNSKENEVEKKAR